LSVVVASLFPVYFLSHEPLLNKHQHHRKQSSVGSVRLLRFAVVHIAFGETRIEITYELFDVGELFVKVIKPKMSNLG
jgi:hypothetical protein